MTADDQNAENDALQFDRVEGTASAPLAMPAEPSVPCAACGDAITQQYYHLNGRPTCDRCRAKAGILLATPKGMGPLGKAAMFGIGAAIAGAVVYYGVMEITGLEIGIVAILIGYMVGWGVRRGAGGRGGRRFQILAVVLTYWSVGLAYSPSVLKGMTEGKSTSSLSSTAAGSTADSASVNASKGTGGSAGMSPVVAILLLIGFVFALPVLAVFGSLPAGLISGFIIFIGLRTAWRMTAGIDLVQTGPFRVGAAPTAAGG